MTTRTPLDDMLMKAIDTPHKWEGEYYTLFLNSVIYVPTWDIPNDNLDADSDEEEMSFTPMVMEDNGEQIVCIFDSEERLLDWAEGDDVNIISLQGYDVLELLGEQYILLLNTRTEYAKEFSIEESQYILSSVEAE